MRLWPIVMAYIVMAFASRCLRARLHITSCTYILMAYVVVAYVVMACILMACACSLPTCQVTCNVVCPGSVLTEGVPIYTYGLYSYGLYIVMACACRVPGRRPHRRRATHPCLPSHALRILLCPSRARMCACGTRSRDGKRIRMQAELF